MGIPYIEMTDDFYTSQSLNQYLNHLVLMIARMCLCADWLDGRRCPSQPIAIEQSKHRHSCYLLKSSTATSPHRLISNQPIQRLQSEVHHQFDYASNRSKPIVIIHQDTAMTTTTISPSKPLADRDPNTTSPSKQTSTFAKPSASTVSADQIEKEQPRSMEYHRQILQNRLAADNA